MKLTDKNLADIDSALTHTGAFREAATATLAASDSPSRVLTLIHKATSARMALDYLLLGCPADASIKMADSTDDCAVKGHDLYTAVKYLRQLAKEGFIASLTGPLPAHERNALGYISDRFVAAMNAGTLEPYSDETGTPKKAVAWVTTAAGRQAVFIGDDLQVGFAGYLVPLAAQSTPGAMPAKGSDDPRARLPADLAKLKNHVQDFMNTNFDGVDIMGVFEACFQVYGNFKPTERAEAARYIMREYLQDRLMEVTATFCIGKAREAMEVDYMKTTLKPSIVEVGVGRMETITPGDVLKPQDGGGAVRGRTPESLWFTHPPEEIRMGLDTSPPDDMNEFAREGWEAVKTFSKCLHTIGAPASRAWQAGFAAHMAIMPPNRPLSPSYGYPEQLAYGEGFAARLAGIVATTAGNSRADSWDGKETACPYSLFAPGMSTRRNAWFDGYNDAGE